MSENNAGIQLDSQTLYLRQKRLRESGLVTPGPDLVAAGISVPENIGMLLRLADAGAARRVVLVNESLPKLERIRKTARSTDVLVEWQIEPLSQFLAHLADLQAPLIAVELTTTSTNLFKLCFRHLVRSLWAGNSTAFPNKSCGSAVTPSISRCLGRTVPSTLRTPRRWRSLSGGDSILRRRCRKEVRRYKCNK